MGRCSERYRKENMKYKVLFSPLAKQELEESIDWYNHAKSGLGRQFYKQIKETISTIKNNPYSFAYKYKTIRMATVSKYPFAIHYSIDEKNKVVPIHGIFHTSRNPNIIKKRIP